MFSDAVSHDDQVTTRTLPFTFSLYGAGINSLSVSTNGNLNTNADNTTQRPLGSTSGSYISGLHDDLYITAGSGQSVQEISNSNYYAVSYLEGLFIGPTPNNRATQVDFQIALFGANTTIAKNGKSFDFLAGDIVYSYNQVKGFSSGDAVVGVSGSTVNYTALPGGSSNGLITDGTSNTTNQLNLLPTSDDQFLLFRYSATTGRYDASVQSLASVSAVPEPAFYAMSSLMVCGGAGLLMRRRRKA